MKKILSIALVLILAVSMCACDGLGIGANTGDGDLKDLAIKATSATSIDFTDRDQKFSFTVEVDPDTVVTDHVVYDWYVYASEDGERWFDFAWFTTGDGTRYQNNRPVFDETCICSIYSNTDTPLTFGYSVEAGFIFKITCVARDYFPGYDTSPRKSSASVDFFVYVSDDLPEVDYSIYHQQ